MCWDENFGSVIQPVTVGINMTDSEIWKVIVSHTRWISVVAGGLTPAYIKVPKRSWFGKFGLIRRDQLFSVSLGFTDVKLFVSCWKYYLAHVCIILQDNIDNKNKARVKQQQLYISLAFFMLNEWFFIGYRCIYMSWFWTPLIITFHTPDQAASFLLPLYWLLLYARRILEEILVYNGHRIILSMWWWSSSMLGPPRWGRSNCFSKVPWNDM